MYSVLQDTRTSQSSITSVFWKMHTLQFKPEYLKDQANEQFGSIHQILGELTMPWKKYNTVQLNLIKYDPSYSDIHIDICQTVDRLTLLSCEEDRVRSSDGSAGQRGRLIERLQSRERDGTAGDSCHRLVCPVRPATIPLTVRHQILQSRII